jgi:hypothetical protein
MLLKDTLVYCTAERYGLDELKRLALRKQGLQSGIQCATILASARYAYANTPDNDSKLRAHYLALIIRSRNTFKRSGTMQMEMEAGGLLFFDLFVAMCNHMVRFPSLSPSLAMTRSLLASCMTLLLHHYPAYMHARASTPLLLTWMPSACYRMTSRPSPSLHVHLASPILYSLLPSTTTRSSQPTLASPSITHLDFGPSSHLLFLFTSSNVIVCPSCCSHYHLIF